MATCFVLSENSKNNQDLAYRIGQAVARVTFHCIFKMPQLLRLPALRLLDVTAFAAEKRQLNKPAFLKRRVEDVRCFARETRNYLVPVILEDVENCAVCSQGTLLVVHSEKASCCYDCFMESVKAWAERLLKR
jgi:hypothetical protein